MATEMMTWARRQVFEAFELSSSERLVLLLLADNASWNEETGGWYAYPFQETLAREAGLGRRTVQRVLARLVELGLLSVERRLRKTGFLAGNGYMFHPEVVENPITLTASDAIAEPSTGYTSGEFPEDATMTHPDIAGSATMTPLENSGDVTMTPLENSGDVTMTPLDIAGCATPVDKSADPHDMRMRHGDACVTVTPPMRHQVAHAARADREDVRARLNRHSETSSSSSSGRSPQEKPAGAGDDDETSKTSMTSASQARRFKGVDVAALAEVAVTEMGQELTGAQLEWLITEILARSRRRVGRPGSFVTAAVVNDPEGWLQELNERFAVRRQSSGPPEMCPIPEHAQMNLRAVNCPACRVWREFPATVAQSVIEQLDAGIRAAILADPGVTIIDDHEQAQTG